MNDFLLILTDAAKKYLTNMVKEDQALSIGLKVSGCTGYPYVIKTEPIEGRKIKVFQGINFIINAENEKYLNNSIVDYQKQGLNSKLVIENPSVKNECGCGESFSFKEVA